METKGTITRESASLAKPWRWLTNRGKSSSIWLKTKFNQQTRITIGNKSFGFQISWWLFTFYATQFSLATLFLWKGISGLANYTEIELSFQRQQTFKDWAPHLAKVNIALQLTAGALLSIGLFHWKTRAFGLGVTMAILAGYTSYSQLVLLNAFGFDTCACIGWLEGMSWTGIFIVNTFFLVMVISMLLIALKERRPP